MARLRTELYSRVEGHRSAFLQSPVPTKDGQGAAVCEQLLSSGLAPPVTNLVVLVVPPTRVAEKE